MKGAVAVAAGLVLGALLAAGHGDGRSAPLQAAGACGPYGDLPREGGPVASADGRMLAWARWTWRNQRTRVFVSALDGTQARPVVVPGRPDDWPSAFAPDGRELLIRRSGDPDRYLLAPTEGSAARILSTAEARELRRRWRTLEWSPDGELELQADYDGVWVVPARGGPRRSISDTTLNHAAAWSPDGTRIAFASGHGMASADSDLYVVAADGTGRRRLTRTGDATNPSWSPDGALIAFDADSSAYKEGSSIGVVRPDGSGRRLLTRDRTRNASAVTWVDGDTLAFVVYEQRDGPHRVTDVHTIGLDGRNERRVTYQCHLGTRRDDTLQGSTLSDRLRGFAGDDDVRPGRGRDDVDAGPGNDVVRARDVDSDAIRCGSGRDRVLADRRDGVARDCERVTRS